MRFGSRILFNFHCFSICPWMSGPAGAQHHHKLALIVVKFAGRRAAGLVGALGVNLDFFELDLVGAIKKWWPLVLIVLGVGLLFTLDDVGKRSCFSRLAVLQDRPGGAMAYRKIFFTGAAVEFSSASLVVCVRMPLSETYFLSFRPLALALIALCLLTVAQPAPAAELSTSARSRLFLDKKDPPPKVTPMKWDQPENYDSPASLVEELPPAILDLLGFTPLRIEPAPPTTPRIQTIATGLVSVENGVKAGLSFARRATPDGVCRVFVSKESAVALDDTTFVQWHERAHCDRGYNDRELEESKANVQGYLMMAKTGDLWYAWQSIDNRARLVGNNQPFFAPYLLGYRVASSTILPLLKRRGGPKQELGYELASLLTGMSERQVNALSMLLVEDAKRKQLDGKPWTPFQNGAVPD